MVNVYEAVSANKTKSYIIVVAFFVFVTLVVYVLAQAFSFYLNYQPGGIGYFGLALIISGLMSLGGYYFSDKIVLSISKARPANRKKDFTFYTVVENLCIGTGLPKPKLYVIDDSAPNAFATGRDPAHAAICATTGLLEKLTRSELEGVLAHELSHVKNYDTRLMAIVAVLVGMVALMGDWFLRTMWWGGRDRDRDEDNKLGVIFIVLGIVFAILSPIVAQLIQLAVSRRREFLADASSVEITRQPESLISALDKISADKEPLEVANKATAHLYITNPFKEKGHGAVGWFAGLFNTHPPVSQRIAALKSMVWYEHMAKLTRDDVLHVAKLAKLPLSEKEVQKFVSQLSEVISYISQLSEVDTANTEPTSQPTGLTNVYRKDEVKSEECLSQDDALSGTDQVHNGYFKVKAILEERADK